MIWDVDLFSSKVQRPEMRWNFMYRVFFHTHLWFPASDLDFWWFGNDFRSFSKVIIEKKKHCWRNRIHHGCLCKTEVILVNLYSTNHSLSLVISGIQTHLCELRSARVPMMDSLFPFRVLVELELVGSCATLVAEKITSELDSEPPTDVAKLLYGKCCYFDTGLYLIVLFHWWTG